MTNCVVPGREANPPHCWGKSVQTEDGDSAVSNKNGKLQPSESVVSPLGVYPTDTLWKPRFKTLHIPASFVENQCQETTTRLFLHSLSYDSNSVEQNDSAK